jgi:hypothetical protein
MIFGNENWLWKYNVGTFWRTITHQRILKKNPLSMLILGRNFCFLGPTIVKIPQPNLLNRRCTIQSQLMPNLNTFPLVSFSQKVWSMKIDANLASIIFRLYTSHRQSSPQCWVRYVQLSCLVFWKTEFDLSYSAKEVHIQ